VIASLYAAAARRRREWFAARPDARRRLRRPVISIGNIAAGGRGKTPCAALVARVLLDAGERPAILSRGYARTFKEDGAVVVRDAAGIRSDLARAGDEPLMLARQLPGAIVISSPDRYLAGRLAEHHLGATVHVLDDGFQHFTLDRDVDLVLVASADLAARTFPSGRLREPADVLIAADAIVALDEFDPPFDHSAFFRAARRTGRAVFEGTPVSAGTRVLAVAGIAHPDPFFAAVAGQGFDVAAVRQFADHHPFSAPDVAALAGAARAAGASAIVTTEKDYVRLLPHRPFPLPVGYVPLTMDVEPLDDFRRWLSESIAAARDIVLA
jgi:tetraacyldisaccharide 4'-kinase